MKHKVQARRRKKLLNSAPAKVQGPPQHSAASAAAESGSAAYIPASEAKNRFAAVLESAVKGHEVFIMKHNAPKAVVISVERFRSMSAATASMLDRLTADFDARFARMQTSPARHAMRKAFDASPPALGKAALKAARSRS